MAIKQVAPHLSWDQEVLWPVTRRLLAWCQTQPVTRWPESVQEKLAHWGNTERTWRWIWMRVKEELGTAVTALVVLGSMGLVAWAFWKAWTCE